MIRVEYRKYDAGDFYKNYPEIELCLDGREYHAAYLASLFRDFMLAMGYAQSTVDDYIPPIDGIEDHIEHKLQQNFKKILERNTKVSEESADNVTSSKKDVSGWTIEDWRVEFENWMGVRGMWSAYLQNNVNDNIRLKHYTDILDPTLFLIEAFQWTATGCINYAEDWDALNNEWRDHMDSLKGE